jgi:hypothetical protein
MAGDTGVGTQRVDERAIPPIPWLDAATTSYVRRLGALVVSSNPDVEAVAAARAALGEQVSADWSTSVSSRMLPLYVVREHAQEELAASGEAKKQGHAERAA